MMPAAYRTGLLASERLAAIFWRTTEDRAIRAHYPAGGTAACIPHLPNRTKRAITQRAYRLGIKRKAAA